MLNFIDRWLNSITMYRLVLTGLMVLATIAILMGFWGILPFSGLAMTVSLLVIVSSSLLFNWIFSKVLNAPTNLESATITAFILFLLLTPQLSFNFIQTALIASILAMASKYLLAFHRKHWFNPAAVAAVILGLLGNGSVSWWVGSLVLLPITLPLGLLIVRKIRRFQMWFAFMAASLIAIGFTFGPNSASLPQLYLEVLTSWPIIFFSTVMFTEPLTTPSNQRLRIIYGVIVGILFGIQYEFGPVFSTPELALVIGNVFSYLVSPKDKLFLKLKSKTNLSPMIMEFAFSKVGQFNFMPGQYLEWTLPMFISDLRGNRRYFTIASSPTEDEVRLSIRLAPKGSKFKSKLTELPVGGLIVASQLAGDFILPTDTNKKLVMIAGGIGITPFRSMIKYLVDKKEQREIVLFYSATKVEDFVYRELFDRAAKVINLKTVYLLADGQPIPSDWKGKIGYITDEMIRQEVPDYQSREFYLSGPNAMVKNYQKLLRKLNINWNQIKTDFFPGF